MKNFIPIIYKKKDKNFRFTNLIKNIDGNNYEKLKGLTYRLEEELVKILKKHRDYGIFSDKAEGGKEDAGITNNQNEKGFKVDKKVSSQCFFHPNICYLMGLCFLVMGTGGMLGSEEISESLMPFVYLATLLGPVIAGILLIAIVDGKSGFKDFSSRLFKWKIAAHWYAVALLIAPILISIILFGFSMMSQSFLPTLVNADNKLGLLLTGIVMGLLVGFFEEVGWTGFAVPKLL
jgi:hypothetical protein